jgi:hypothetical protein
MPGGGGGAVEYTPLPPRLSLLGGNVSEVNYLAYAQEMGRRNENAAGLNAISTTLDAQEKMAMEAPRLAQEKSLRQLQIQQAVAGLADTRAKQGALSSMGGSLQGAYEQQMQREQDQKKLEAKQKGMETYLNTIKALDGMPNLDPATKTEIGKQFLRQNPEYAPMAENLSFIDSKGVKAARQFADGELKDPVTGQPLPAGYYETVGVWTGDAANPVKLTSYKLVPKKSAAENVGGGGGGKGSGHGGTPAGGKPIPAGTLTDLNEASQMVKTLKEAQGLSAGVNTGPIMGRLQSAAQYFGAAPGDFTQMKQKIATVNNSMLKLRSGAAVTESEYQRFLQEMPTANDTETVRDSKFANATKYMEDLLEGKIATFSEGGYKVPTGVVDRSKPTGKQSAQPGNRPITTKGGFKVTRVP